MPKGQYDRAAAKRRASLNTNTTGQMSSQRRSRTLTSGSGGQTRMRSRAGPSGSNSQIVAAIHTLLNQLR